MTEAETTTEAKRLAALRSADYVRDGMLVGLGSGSTAELAIAELGRRVASGLRFQGVPSSNRTRDLATGLGIPLVDLDRIDRVDLVIDGADEVDPRFSLIKGHGGALVREKLLAEAASRVVIVVDQTKLVETLGRSPVPVEILPFGWRQTLRRITAVGVTAAPRMIAGALFVSDNGNYVADCRLGEFRDSLTWHERLKRITGVVETGIFVDLVDVLIVGTDRDVTVRENPARGGAGRASVTDPYPA
ncbi:MAG: ribose 5-phosphate isomerase A [Candidatus Rokuibacteriota bacterium]|nr:MAG: ribose 5-phosphate isomerase A [Candidatus Rokubacteria bacterium]